MKPNTLYTNLVNALLQYTELYRNDINTSSMHLGAGDIQASQVFLEKASNKLDEMKDMIREYRDRSRNMPKDENNSIFLFGEDKK